MILDPIVNGEIDGPSGQIPQDGRSQTAIHAADAIVLEDRLDGG